MTTLEKSNAIIDAVKEYQTIYAAVKAPATPPTMNDTIVEGMMKGLKEKIAAIISAE